MNTSARDPSQHRLVTVLNTSCVRFPDVHPYVNNETIAATYNWIFRVGPRLGESNIWSRCLHRVIVLPTLTLLSHSWRPSADKDSSYVGEFEHVSSGPPWQKNDRTTSLLFHNLVFSDCDLLNDRWNSASVELSCRFCHDLVRWVSTPSSAFAK